MSTSQICTNSLDWFSALPDISLSFSSSLYTLPEPRLTLPVINPLSRPPHGSRNANRHVLDAGRRSNGH